MALSPGLARLYSGTAFRTLAKLNLPSRLSKRKGGWRELRCLFHLVRRRRVRIPVFRVVSFQLLYSDVSSWRIGARGYHTATRVGLGLTQKRGFSTSTLRSAPITEDPAPVPRTTPSKVALIGARGYTGQTLTSLLSSHPYINLSHVSSRTLVGRPLEEYTKSEVVYSNLGVKEVQDMERAGEVDAWVLALPNGAARTFVEGLKAVEAERVKEGKGAEGKGSVVVDLSADYRFAESQGWTYGLPGVCSI
jgi:hypothetical protein